MQVLASQLHFLVNRNAGLSIPPLFWLVNCIKIGGHVALPSGPTVHSLYCGHDRVCLRYTCQHPKPINFKAGVNMHYFTCMWIIGHSNVRLILDLGMKEN